MGPFRIVRPRFLVYSFLEISLVVAVMFGLATLTLAWAPLEHDSARAFRLSVGLVSAMFCAVLLAMQVGRLGDQGSLRREILLFSFISVVLGLLTFSAIWILFPRERSLPAVLALEGAVAVPLALALWRWLSQRWDVFNLTRERILILGTSESAQEFCRWIVNNCQGRFVVIGFVDPDGARAGTVLTMGVRVQTDYESLPSFCTNRVDRVVVSLEEKRGTLPLLPLMELRLRGIEVEEATTFFERASGKIAVETMLPSWLIFSEGFKSTPIRRAIKRVADLVFASVLLLVAAPLMVVTAVLIKLDSRGPLLYRQERLGRDAKRFSLLKFRSMRHRAESTSGPTWTIRNDPRVTRVGRVIRVLRIDELPQLINVLRGEMSFVGPRPERDHFVRQLITRIPYYGLRMTVRPGITGWSQVEYGYGANEQDALEKLKYDLYYIKNANLLFDMWIVLKTVRVVILGTGAR